MVNLPFVLTLSVTSCAPVSERSVFAIKLQPFLYTTFFISAAVVTTTLTSRLVFVAAGGTLKAIVIGEFALAASGVAFALTPSLLFPLVSTVFTVNVYSVPFVSPET